MAGRPPTETRKESCSRRLGRNSDSFEVSRNAISAVPQQCTAGGSSPELRHDLVFPAGPIHGTVVQQQFFSHLQPIAAGQNRQNIELCVGCPMQSEPQFQNCEVH